jgi:hypothetical protein
MSKPTIGVTSLDGGISDDGLARYARAAMNSAHETSPPIIENRRFPDPTTARAESTTIMLDFGGEKSFAGGVSAFLKGDGVKKGLIDSH